MKFKQLHLFNLARIQQEFTRPREIEVLI